METQRFLRPRTMLRRSRKLGFRPEVELMETLKEPLLMLVKDMLGFRPEVELMETTS